MGKKSIVCLAKRRRILSQTLSGLVLMLLVLVFPLAVAAQNATQQTTNDIVRSSTQSVASLISGRIEFVNAPMAPMPPGSGPAPGPGDGKPRDGGIPVPGKDRAALSLPAGSAPGFAGNTMLAMAALGEQTGLSAGDEAARRRCGVWGMTAVNWIGSSQSGASFDGNLVTAMTGFDYRILDPLVAGVALGYQWVDLTTHYNQGFLKSGGLTVMPYLSYSLTPNLVADASFGLGFNNYNTARIDTAASQEVNGHYNSLRSLGSANLTYYHLTGNWTLSAKAGTILANEYQYYYVENNATRHAPMNTFLGELIIGGKAAYRYKMFVPQIGINYLYDYALAGGGDRDEVQGVLALGVQASDRLLINFECANSFFREYTRNTSLTGAIRFEF
ncbi:autotransporter outer membrane beta-barrel domain-containing protein [Desulfovibrio sp. DV]|uniref:autotransporter outer membrane beta-barrel domain-containing protein n=1 Tax=Desulfovibrio sp. DV TaxID=1844708 RepID=UPI000AA2BBC5|nr:autotransporter outer membrane beta-barrel domain-containing protein [Desulfovibrio sp. DV]